MACNVSENCDASDYEEGEILDEELDVSVCSEDFSSPETRIASSDVDRDCDDQSLEKKRGHICQESSICRKERSGNRCYTRIKRRIQRLKSRRSSECSLSKDDSCFNEYSSEVSLVPKVPLSKSNNSDKRNSIGMRKLSKDSKSSERLSFEKENEDRSNHEKENDCFQRCRYSHTRQKPNSKYSYNQGYRNHSKKGTPLSKDWEHRKRASSSLHTKNNPKFGKGDSNKSKKSDQEIVQNKNTSLLKRLVGSGSTGVKKLRDSENEFEKDKSEPKYSNSQRSTSNNFEVDRRHSSAGKLKQNIGHPALSNDDDDEALNLRVEALRSAMLKKHNERKKKGFKFKKETLGDECVDDICLNRNETVNTEKMSIIESSLTPIHNPSSKNISVYTQNVSYQLNWKNQPCNEGNMYAKDQHTSFSPVHMIHQNFYGGNYFPNSQNDLMFNPLNNHRSHLVNSRNEMQSFQPPLYPNAGNYMIPNNFYSYTGLPTLYNQNYQKGFQPPFCHSNPFEDHSSYFHARPHLHQELNRSTENQVSGSQQQNNQCSTPKKCSEGNTLDAKVVKPYSSSQRKNVQKKINKKVGPLKFKLQPKRKKPCIQGNILENLRGKRKSKWDSPPHSTSNAESDTAGQINNKSKTEDECNEDKDVILIEKPPEIIQISSDDDNDEEIKLRELALSSCREKDKEITKSKCSENEKNELQEDDTNEMDVGSCPSIDDDVIVIEPKDQEELAVKDLIIVKDSRNDGKLKKNIGPIDTNELRNTESPLNEGSRSECDSKTEEIQFIEERSNSEDNEEHTQERNFQALSIESSLTEQESVLSIERIQTELCKNKTSPEEVEGLHNSANKSKNIDSETNYDNAIEKRTFCEDNWDEVDEDILRAQLLSSLSKNIPLSRDSQRNPVNKPVIQPTILKGKRSRKRRGKKHKKVEKNTESSGSSINHDIANPPSKNLVPSTVRIPPVPKSDLVIDKHVVSPQQRIIISLNDASDSTDDEEPAVKKIKSFVNNPRINDIETSVDKLLSEARMKAEDHTDSPPSPNVNRCLQTRKILPKLHVSTLYKSSTNLKQNKTPSAVRHLPTPKREEYRQLKLDLAKREQKQKLDLLKKELNVLYNKVASKKNVTKSLTNTSLDKKEKDSSGSPKRKSTSESNSLLSIEEVSPKPKVKDNPQLSSTEGLDSISSKRNTTTEKKETSIQVNDKELLQTKELTLQTTRTTCLREVGKMSVLVEKMEKDKAEYISLQQELVHLHEEIAGIEAKINEQTAKILDRKSNILRFERIISQEILKSSSLEESCTSLGRKLNGSCYKEGIGNKSYECVCRPPGEECNVIKMKMLDIIARAEALCTNLPKARSIRDRSAMKRKVSETLPNAKRKKISTRPVDITVPNVNSPQKVSRPDNEEKNSTELVNSQNIPEETEKIPAVEQGAEGTAKVSSNRLFIPSTVESRTGKWDPFWEVCPFDISGTCKDPECKFQHFKPSDE